MSNGSDNDPLSTGGAFGVWSELSPPGEDKFVGRELGDYRVTGLIAEGGMGRVYRAERIDGSFERDVAIKVSMLGGFDERLRSRFLAEQGILASLNHPNICQLYDAQVSAEGWPYIVMELVDGEAIDRFVRSREASVRQRVALLIDVVDAIAYAHARLVVHRDIKPSNIVVNADGRPKLLDFGIARLLEKDTTMLTQAGAMTPRYASPEQLLGQDIAVASDIYQLGLLIFEVLTGRPVYSEETLTAAIRRAAEGRSPTLPAEGRRILDRELLLIIEQCLRAVPEERYRDANSLRADLAAFRDGFPVTAAGQGAVYRFRKLVRRNVPATVISVSAAIAILTGSAWYTYQVTGARAEAERQAAAAKLEAEKANQVSNFFVSLFAKAEPQSARGQDVLVRDLLDLGIDEARNELEGQDELRAALLMTIGGVKNEMGYYDEAVPLIDEAVAIYRHLDLEDPVPLANALYQRAVVDWYTAELEDARSRLDEAQALVEKVDSRESLHQQTFLLNTLGMVASQLNDFDAAIAYHERSLAARRAYYGDAHWEIAASLLNFASVYSKLGRYEEALPLFEQAYQASIESLEPYDPRISRPALWLGRAYLTEGRLVDAEPLLLQALDIERKVWGEQHANYAAALFNLSKLRIAQGKSDEAAALLEQTIAIERETLGEESPWFAVTEYQLADVYLDLGRRSDAEPLIRKAERVLAGAFPEGHRYTAYALEVAGRFEELSGNHEEAIRKYDRAVDMMTDTVGVDHPHTIKPQLAAARLALEAGGLTIAEARYKRALEVMEKNRREVPPWQEYMAPYIAMLVESGRDADADELRARLDVVRQQLVSSPTG